MTREDLDAIIALHEYFTWLILIMNCNENSKYLRHKREFMKRMKLQTKQHNMNVRLREDTY